jgi:hypothetical protein
MAKPVCDISECCALPSTISFQTTIIDDAGGSAASSLNRYAVANRAFRAGDVIIRNAPLSCALLVQTSSTSEDDQRYCAHCYATEAKLSRCGRCKSIWYCSRDCQKSDFPVHKIECAYFSSSSFLHRPQMLQNDRVVAELCLLIRTFAVSRNRETQNGAGTNHSPCTRQYHAKDCGIDHLFALARSSLPLDSVDQLMITEATNAIWSKRQVFMGKTGDTSKEWISQQVEVLLRIFRVNNFGITDELLRVVASAVYPLGALLNHSCKPNCILRYHYCKQGTNKHPPILEIAACRDIKPGEELTHSYVELVQPIDIRRDRLRSSYGFHCECDRCTLEKGERPTLSEKETDLLQLQEPSLIRKWLDFFNPISTSTTTTPDICNPVRVVKSSDSKLLRQMIDQSRSMSKQCMTMDNLQGELECLSNAVHLLCQLLEYEHQEHNGASLSSKKVSLELYQLRGELLGIQIVAGHTEQAVMNCEYMVAFLASTLCSPNVGCHNHPILGLQLFTLGDLYQAMESEDDHTINHEMTLNTFSWAREILSVSHGEHSNMMSLLRDKTRA